MATYPGCWKGSFLGPMLWMDPCRSEVATTGGFAWKDCCDPVTELGLIPPFLPIWGLGGNGWFRTKLPDLNISKERSAEEDDVDHAVWRCSNIMEQKRQLRLELGSWLGDMSRTVGIRIIPRTVNYLGFTIGRGFDFQAHIARAMTRARDTLQLMAVRLLYTDRGHTN
ncbi:hypothetical protein RUM43_006591 [Polyplax serrata]|uniref:Uncharacterized protein n=1 Tax=Polyplax serrata TaxID=468196 RepID=A0AAN8NYF4_POLSC